MERVNSDFEVHQNGTIAEIRLCRALARSIEQVLTQYGEVIPHSVLVEYKRLKAFYESRNWSV